ncbi:2-oxo acid dehydrogenase subunit E2 [Streptomyces albidus (ex Kaewkla and Franco 2022)]|uniref:2-oxo acid dehydrogenase subunit E2 n=1 Tax=Streptomyces albidus (ex Kaewkla and Franco 2022) TaxID=722709 RepID=UPI0015EF0DDE|nr:2-oxo acid dehydrogenase subunit E2 [Streptomyces albidus (ex Kaewkla and Franco 2022)]
MSEITVPRLNNNDASYVFLEWLFEDGQDVPGDAVVAMVETAKAVEEIVAESAGVLRQERKPGEECAPGDVLGRLLDPAESGSSSPAAAPSQQTPDEPELTVTEPAAAFMAEHGISRSDVASLGKPVVTRADVEQLAAGPAQDGERVVDLGRHQQAVAATVEQSMREIPQAFALMRIKGTVLAQERKAVRLETGLVFTTLEVLVLAAGRLASEFPMIHARRIDEGRVALADDVHVGVTIDSGNGLYIPVVRSVATKSLSQVTGELEEFRRKSLTGDFRARDLTGAHLSVSVAGYTDLTCSVPFVQPGQSCMLSLCGTQYEADPASGRRVPYFNVGLSYDHRVVNGRLAAHYLKSVKALLESPEKAAEICRGNDPAVPTMWTEESRDGG